MARRKIYFKTRAEALEVWAEERFPTRQIYKLKYGKYKGMYVVCTYMVYLNGMYYL